MNIINIAPFGLMVPLRPIDGKGFYNKVLVKFSFTNHKHIPEGIEEKKRENNATMDHHHALAAISSNKHELAVPNRLRPGRFDTGNKFIDNLQFMHIGCLVRGLSNTNFAMSGIHWFHKIGEGGSSDKFVVCVTYKHSVDNVTVPQKSLEQLRKLASTCWQYCHAYANFDGAVTLNMGGRLPDGKPKHSVVVRNGHIMAARITRFVTESEE